MKDSPNQKQVVTPSLSISTKESRKSRFFLAFLGLMVLVLIIEGIYWLKLRREKEGLVSQVVPVTPTSEERIQVSFSCPVSENYCQEGKEAAHYLMLNLPLGLEVKAVTSGETSLLQDSFGYVTVKLQASSGSSVFYTFGSIDDLEFTPPKSVKKGEILGKAGLPLTDQSPYNLILRITDKNNNYYSNLKEIFTQ